MFWVCSWLGRLTELRRTKQGTAKNLGRDDPGKMSRDNRNLLMLRGSALRPSQERLVDQPHNFCQTERNSGNGFALPAAISRGPRPEIRPGSNFHWDKLQELSEKHSPPGDKAPATLNPWETLDRNPTKRGVLQIPAQSRKTFISGKALAQLKARPV